MELKFSNDSINLQVLREFCKQEGEAVVYRKGEQMEREGEPSKWFGFVAEGCFKYTVRGIDDEREHITWISFDGEFVGDYPAGLNGRPAQNTIEAMAPSRVFRVSCEQLLKWFDENSERMELRSIIGEYTSTLSWHRSFARLARHRLVPLHHPTDALQNTQRNHFRDQAIAKL